MPRTSRDACSVAVLLGSLLATSPLSGTQRPRRACIRTDIATQRAYSPHLAGFFPGGSGSCADRKPSRRRRRDAALREPARGAASRKETRRRALLRAEVSPCARRGHGRRLRRHASEGAPALWEALDLGKLRPSSTAPVVGARNPDVSAASNTPFCPAEGPSGELEADAPQHEALR